MRPGVFENVAVDDTLHLSGGMRPAGEGDVIPARVAIANAVTPVPKIAGGVLKTSPSPERVSVQLYGAGAGA